MIGYTSWKSSEVGHEDLLFENRNSTSQSLDWDVGWNQNILKGGGAKICPGLIPTIWNSGDKSAWPLAASVTGVYMYFSVGCWTEDVFVVDRKMLCGFSSI